MSLNMVEQAGFAAPVHILGVRVDRVSQQQVLLLLQRLIVARREQGERVRCQQIVTVNPEFVMEAQRNDVFRQCINQAALVVADGMGIVWATRYLRTPVPERITGIDTLIQLAKLCAEHGYRLYLLGAAPGVAEAAAKRLCELNAGLLIAGTYAGSPAVAEEDEIIERIRVAQTDVLCVAYGAPAQELWIARHLARLPVAIAMGVGGAYDFISGRQSRAPSFMQRAGLEWLYRLYCEPWRWRRMLALPRFAVQILMKGRNAS